MHNTDTEIEFSPDQLAIREQVAAQLQRITAPFDPARSVDSVATVGPKRTHRPKGAGTFYYNPQKKKWIGRIQIEGKRTEVYGKSREDAVARLSQALEPALEIASRLGTDPHSAQLRLFHEQVPYEVEVRQVLLVEATSIDAALQHIRYGYPDTEILSIRKGKT